MQKESGNTNQAVYRKPKRIFEKSGAVNPEASYYVPMENVVNTDNQDVKTMVDLGRFFSIFAPRQSGKTTFFKRMCDQLHTDRTYIAIILNFQQYEESDKEQFYHQIEKKLYTQLRSRLEEVKCDKLETVGKFLDEHRLTDHLSFGMLFEELNRLIEFKKIVIFIDEFDGIPLKELGNFLTTLRNLYQEYKEVKQKALYSIGLVGIRNITKLIVGGVSPFNIADQVEMPPFSFENIAELYAQYTRETHQPFTSAAVKTIHRETAGQPWLVNRLGTLLTVKIKPGTVDPIDEEDVVKAVKILVEENNVHFDNLDEKARRYKETFIEIIFDNVKHIPGDGEQSWLRQFGLVKNKNGKAVVANNIYKARYVQTFFREARVPEDVAAGEYDLPGNRLDMENLLLDFEHYIAQIGVRAFYQGKKPYEKTGQFLLTAWLYRFVKGGEGDLRYELVSGLGRIDIILNYRGRKYIIETKVNHRKLSRTLDSGIAQLSKKYLATEAVDEGFLVVFDTKTPAGEDCEPQYHPVESKRITSFVIGIGTAD